MIWALLAWYFFGGASGIGANLLTLQVLSDLSDKVEVTVVDTDRRDHALETLGVLKKDVRRFKMKFVRSGRQLNKLYKDHSAHPDDALVILDSLNSDWEARQSQALDSWFELRRTLTEDEWNQLFGPP